MAGKISTSFMQSYGTSPRHERPRVKVLIPGSLEDPLQKMEPSPDGVIAACLTAANKFKYIVPIEEEGGFENSEITQITKKLREFNAWPTEIGLIQDKNWVENRNEILEEALCIIIKLKKNLISYQGIVQTSAYQDMQEEIFTTLEWVWTDYIEASKKPLFYLRKPGLKRLLSFIRRCAANNKMFKDGLNLDVNFQEAIKVFLKL